MDMVRKTLLMFAAVLALAPGAAAQERAPGLGGVHAVQESRAGQVRPMAFVGDAVAEQSLQAADTPISPGEIDIRATVTVSFLIQRAAAGPE